MQFTVDLAAVNQNELNKIAQILSVMCCLLVTENQVDFSVPFMCIESACQLIIIIGAYDLFFFFNFQINQIFDYLNL